jgi:hypothetical protein
MASRACLLLPLLLAAFLASAQAVVFTVATGAELAAAAAAAGDGDSIFLSANITITSTVVFKTSISIFGQGFTITVAETSYGLYFRGSSTTVIYVENLTVDGASISRFDPVIYIASSGGTAVVKSGPTATFVDVTIQNVIDIAPTIYYGRGAALEVNTGSTVNYTGGSILNNFAELGGAVEVTGSSFLLLCNTLFSGNTAGPSFASATDYWVGLQSHLAYSYDPTAPGFIGIPPPSGGFNNTKGRVAGSTSIKNHTAGAPCPTLAEAFAGFAPYPAASTKKVSAKKKVARRLYGRRHME